MKKLIKKVKGFTLLEILLVVGIIAILAGIVIIAINPSKTLATVRNAERKSDLKQIDNALYQYYIDNIKYPTSTESGLQEICNTGSIPYPHIGIDCTGYLDLSILVPTYITAIPRDALASTSSSTGYVIYKSHSSRKIQLIASNAELGVVIAIGTTTAMVSTPITPVAYTWTGAVDGDFANPLNYTPNGIPTSIDSVLMDETRVNNPSAGTLTCSTMTVRDVNNSMSIAIETGASVVGDVQFYDLTYNQTILETGTFYGSSFNAGVVTYGTFNDSSANRYGGRTIYGTFNDSSSNDSSGGVVINGTFYDNSYNTGTVDNATCYWPAPPSGPALGGTITNLPVIYLGY